MTDHCGLRYLFDQPKLNSRQARWMALLSEFDFEIKHIKGKENKAPVLKIVDPENEFVVCTNSCKEGLEGVLM